MPTPRPEPLRAALLLGALLLPASAGTAAAQQVEVISNQIAVSSRDATLELELSDDTSLEISFQGGDVLVDGEDVGDYARGDALETAWRTLLGETVALDDGPLAQALREWEPPEELEGESLALGRRIDEALEGRLRGSRVDDEAEPAADAGEDPQQGETVAALLRRADRLEGLAEALEDLSLADVSIRIGEDVTVDEEEEIDATLIVVDGDLDVHGQIRGDVILAGGALRMHDAGHVAGEVRLVDARIFRNGGTIDGRVTNVTADPGAEIEDVREIRERIRSELREELRDEIRDEIRGRFRDDFGAVGILSPLRHVGRGLAGILQSLISLLIAGALATAVVHFFPENLEVVAENARQSPGRAAVVGMAGAFLLFPVWLLGIVALAITIIGIPALVAWIPLFPLAASLAAALGYLAVASLVGEWVARQRYAGLDFLRPSNRLHTVLAGLVALALPFVAANVVEMAGNWLDFVQGLFTTVGVLACVSVTAVGFGSVLLTRGGRRGGWSPSTAPFDMEWPGAPEERPEPAADAEGDEAWNDLEEQARRRRERDEGPGNGPGRRSEPDQEPDGGGRGPGARPGAEPGSPDDERGEPNGESEEGRESGEDPR